MPPKRGAADARMRENMYFEPGVRGRKTGLTVPDTGIRDEMGMEPIDDLFSSPEKTVVMAPPPPPAMTAAVASARKPAPAKTPKAAPRTAKKHAQVQSQAQQAQMQMETQPSPALQPQPQQQFQPQQNGSTRQVPITDETNSMEESMQFGNSTIPEPTAVLTERRKSLHQPLPRSTSPKKTFLGSPARRHPSIQPGESSPTRGTIMSPPKGLEKEPVARKLNFSHPGHDVFAPQTQLQTQKFQPAVPNSPAPAAASKAPILKTPGATNGKRKRASLEKENGQDESVDEQAPDSVRSMPGAWEEPTPFPSQKKSDRSFDLSPTSGLGGDGEEEYQPMQMDEDEVMEDNFEQLLERTATPPESEPEKRAKKDTKKKARVSLETAKDVEREKEGKRGKGKEVAVPEEKKAGRPKSKEKEQEAVIPMAQAAEYLAIEEASKIYSEDEEPALPPPKRSKLCSKDVNRKISIKKATQLAKDVESSPVQIQRGPPRPRGNGLFILRRETPAVGPFATTRVGLGRPKVQPVVRWGNEDTYVEDDQVPAPSTRQPAHRDDVDLDDTPQTRQKSTREIEEGEEQDLAEPWESAPGRINGMVKEWASSNPSSTDSPEREDEIAFSGPAIITRTIPGSEVQFAKTLTLPFFGSGMVDLPPGAIKRPKNSRKMQMVFFVFKGNVKVTVNENTFRISAGGMWQVPRGNMYSIENDYEKEARIFFSQGCEVGKEE